MSNSLRAYARQLERENHGHVSHVSEGRGAPAHSAAQPVAHRQGGRNVGAGAGRPRNRVEERAPHGTGIALATLASLGFWAAVALIWIGRPDAILWIVAGAFAVASIVRSFTDSVNAGE